MLRRILAPPLTRVSVVRSIAIDATTSLASRASARLPADCDQPTRDQNGRRSAAASYWSDSGERGTSRVVRRNFPGRDTRFGLQRKDPDRSPVRTQRTKGRSLGCAERRGVKDHVIIVVVFPESPDPGRVGRARVGKGSNAGQHRNQRRHKEPKAHTEPNANRSLMVVASHRPARGPKIDQGYPNMRSRRPGRLALTAVVSSERFPIDVDADNRLMPGRASHLDHRRHRAAARVDSLPHAARRPKIATARNARPTVGEDVTIAGGAWAPADYEPPSNGKHP